MLSVIYRDPTFFSDRSGCKHKYPASQESSLVGTSVAYICSLLTGRPGFFTYISDTQEQDIEFLSSDVDYYQHLYYTNQPGQLPNSDPDPDAAKVNTYASDNIFIYVNSPSAGCGGSRSRLHVLAFFSFLSFF